MLIARVQAENFGPFEALDVALDTPGVTLLEGVIDSKDGCSSNGSGKSTVVEAVAWCLFGRTMRDDWSGDALIRNGAMSCHARVTITGDAPIIVTRYRKDRLYKNTLRFSVGGEDRSCGRDDLTQAALETTLRMNYQTFANTVAFGARPDVKSFFSAPDSARKAILEQLLQLDGFAAAQEVARKEMRTWEETQTKWQQSLQQAEGALLHLQQQEADVPDLHVLEAQEASCISLKLKTRQLQQQQVELTAERQTRLESVQSAMADYNAALQALREQDRSVLSADRAADIATAAWKTAKERHLEAEGDLAAAQSSGLHCRTCGQPLPADQLTERIDELKAKVSKLDKARQAAKEKRQAAKEAHEAAKAERDCQSQPTPPTTPDTSDLNESIAANAKEMAGLSSEIVRVTTTVNAHRETLKRIAERRELAKASLAKATAMTAESAEASQLARFWYDAFGDRGIKSFMLESALPEISKHATYYARQLFGDKTTVMLTATKKLKSKDESREKLDVQVTIPGAADSYGAGSKGQRVRLDIALLLAFRHVIAKRASCPFTQLFVDEVFDGVDRAGSATLVDVLRDVAQDQPVLLISHDDTLKDRVERVITVHHDGEVARIRA